MSRSFRVESAPWLWPSMTVVGIAAVSLSAWSLVGMEGSPLGGWSFYTLLVGIAVLIWGAWEWAVYFKRVRRLRSLLSKEGKAHLVRNVEEMEYLAWCLPSHWSEAVSEKKRSYRVK